MATRRRVGIVGYGKLGQYLCDAILDRPELKLSLAFVWNRSPDRLNEARPEVKEAAIAKLEGFEERGADLIVEVAHPDITRQWGARFLSAADYMVGSPTVFADAEAESATRAAAVAGRCGLYIPAGALWGAPDIQKMDEGGSLRGLQVTMKKHPRSFQLKSAELVAANAAAEGVEAETVLYEGPVRALCPMAPNNVNTMAAACLAAPSLGFDGVVGRLVADPRLEEHTVEVLAVGPGEPPFTVHAVRHNPARPGAVTGNATFASFVASMVRSQGRGPGVHFA